jgi:hypothetical protein
MPVNDRAPAWVTWAAAAWLALALALGGTGRLAGLRPPAPQLVLAGLTAALIVLGATVPSLKAWLGSLDPGVVLVFHLTRFVGIYFLVLYGRGQLPYAFAVPCGWGDIAVATFAAVLLILPRGSSRWRQALLVWNTLGLIDILFVVVTAARLGLADPPSMAALLRLPLSLLPTFVVPVIIASHVWVFARAGSRAPAPAAR